MGVRIVTDSTADLPPALAAALAITVVPLTVHFGDRAYRDGTPITPDDLCRDCPDLLPALRVEIEKVQVAAGKLPTTPATAPVPPPIARGSSQLALTTTSARPTPSESRTKPMSMA